MADNANAGAQDPALLALRQQIDAVDRELLEIMATLERHYRDMCDIEFTVEHGKLWMLQTRVGKRTPEAAFRIAVHMADEGLIDWDEAVRRVTGAQLASLMFPRFDAEAERTLLATGMAASPGAAVPPCARMPSRRAISSARWRRWAERANMVRAAP